MKAKHGEMLASGLTLLWRIVYPTRLLLRRRRAQVGVKIIPLTGERRRLVVLTSVTKHVFQAFKNMGNMSSEVLGLTNVSA